MLVRRAFRYELVPDARQAMLCRRFAGCTRAVHNAALEQRSLAYRLGGHRVGWVAQANELPGLKRTAGLEWLAEAPSHVLQQALRDLDQAFTNFFAGRAAYPKARRKGDRDAFRFPDPAGAQIGLDPGRQGWVRLPKLGWLRYRLSRAAPFAGRLLYVTVARDADRWFVSFTCEVETPDPVAPDGAPLGLDLGVRNSVTTSQAEHIHLPVTTDREWERLALLRARAAAKQRGSHNRRKANVKVARQLRRIRCRKQDAIHKLTTRLASRHAVICVEDLRVKNMTRSAKGTLEEPGSHVAQKAGLNRAILDHCWGEIRRQLTYKTTRHGATLMVVPAANSSRQCAACAHTAPENRESQAVFRCEACGHEAHADINAAVNIRERGIAALTDPQATRTAGTADPAASPEARTPAHAPHPRARGSRKRRGRPRRELTTAQR